MAEGKQIQVRIAAVGGTQAAGEIRKVGQALDSTSTQSNKAAGGLTRYAQAGNAANMSSGQMRSGIQNAAFQFQDMAVQAEMGTSAVRIFSQQVPQLLGGLGPIGAVAGVVAGVGVPLAASMMGTAKAAKEKATQLKDLDEALKDHAEALKQTAAEKRAEEQEDWLENLDEEEKYYDKINARLIRQIALQVKLRGDKEDADSAEREARISEIEADPNLSDEQKIKGVAGIREEDARAKLEAKKAALIEDAARKRAAAADAQAKAVRQAEYLAKATALREEKEAQKAALDAEVEAGRKAKENVPKLKKELANEKFLAGRLSSPGVPFDESAFDEAQKTISDLQARLKSAEALIAKTKANADQSKALGAEITGLKAGEKKQADQASVARTSAENAYGESLTAEAEIRLRSPQFDRAFQAQSTTRARRTETELREAEDRRRRAEKQKADKAAREARAAERDRLTGAIDTNQEALDSTARDSGLDLRKRGLASGNKTVQAVGKALADGTTADELQSLGDMVREAQTKNGAAITGFLLQLIADLNTQAQQIEILKKQIKNK